MIKLIFGFFLLFSQPVFAQETPPSISVVGVGTVSTAPDIARVRLGVSMDARTARDALSETSRAMQNVLDILADEGILPTDIQTTDLSLFPSFENRSSGKIASVVGYRAQNMVAIKVRDLDGLGRVLDRVSEGGSNLIQSIQFARDNTDELMKEARTAAIKDAREKAELYAAAAGISVGSVISIAEGGGSGVSPRNLARGQMESMVMDVPVAQGELSLSASVQVVFLIE